MILGAVVQVEPVRLHLAGFNRRECFTITLTFPIASLDGLRLIGALQLTTFTTEN